MELKTLTREELLDIYRKFDNPKNDRDSVIEAMAAAVDAAMDKLSEQEPDGTHLLKALERIANMDSIAYHSLDSAKITARNALATHKKRRVLKMTKKFEKESRYQILEESHSGHCCFEYTVIDTHIPNEVLKEYYTSVCETFKLEDAKRIRDALNKE